ncbi:hypothetical protein DFH28DRAFT_862641, partial [Melampsora americana]
QHDVFVFREGNRSLSEAVIVHLDYDLYHVSLLLSPKNQSADLKTTLQSTIAGLQPLNATPTVSNHQRVLEMAQCLLGVIEDYETKEKLSPDHKVPFCLRYPTLKSLEELVKANEKKMKRVRYEKAVIFLDGAKRTIGIFIPP